MRAKLLPSGSYRIRIELPPDAYGRRQWKSITRPTEEEAILDARAFERSIGDKVTGLTFARASRAYLDAKKAYLSPATIRGYETIFRSLCENFPSFARITAAAIDERDVQEVVDALNSPAPARHRLQKGLRKASPKTIRNYVGFIQAVLGRRFSRLTLPRKELPDIYVPTDEEIRILLNAVKGTDLDIPVRLAVFGPLRRGEICALELKDFSGNVVHVHSDLVKDSAGNWIRKATPKTTRSDRFVELPEDLVKKIHKQGYVTDLNPNMITFRLRHVVKSAGLPHFRFHDLRHWCASSLHAQGIPDAYIMQRGGWSTDSTLKRVYRHTLQDQSKVMTERSLAFFTSIDA